LKPMKKQERHMALFVAPRAGAWIETAQKHTAKGKAGSRPPRGGVD